MYNETGPCVCPSWSLDLPTFISQVQSGMVLSPRPSWPHLLKQGILLRRCLTLHQSVHFHQALLGHCYHSAHLSPCSLALTLVQQLPHAIRAHSSCSQELPSTVCWTSSHSRHLFPFCTWYSWILLLPHLLVNPVSGTEER